MRSFFANIYFVVVAINISLSIVVDKHSRVENSGNFIGHRFFPGANWRATFGYADMRLLYGK